MFLAIKNNDLKTAQKINDKMYPLVQAFYSPPFLDMHNRMKETLVLLGLMEKAIVRPPLMKLGFKEITALEKAIKQSGI